MGGRADAPTIARSRQLPPGEAPLRILVISQYFWPEPFRINGFVEELRAAGAEVSVLTGQPNYPEGRVYEGYRWYRWGAERHLVGYPVYRLPLIPRGRSGAIGLSLNYLSFILFGWLLGPWLLRGRQFDVMFVYGISPILQGFVGLPLRRLKRAKLVLWVQDIWPDVLVGTGFVKNRRLLGLVGRVVAFLYRRSDLLLTQSEAFIAPVKARAGPTPVEYFPNSGDPPEGGIASPPTALTGRFDIVFAGNLGRAQALGTIAEAAALIADQPDIHITLFGSGAMEAWLAQEIETRRLANISIGGRLPPEAMPDVYRRASAVLLTLVADEMVNLTVPSKLQSYLGAGVPIIAAVTGEPARIVAESGGGIVCPPEDASRLAEAMRAMHARPPAERVAMREAGRTYFAAHFQPHLLAQELIARFKQLIVPAEGVAR